MVIEHVIDVDPAQHDTLILTVIRKTLRQS
jgi:hypothetical protein